MALFFACSPKRWPVILLYPAPGVHGLDIAFDYGMPSPEKRDTGRTTSWSTTGSKPWSFPGLWPNLAISLHYKHAL